MKRTSESKLLRLAAELALPLDAATQTFAFLGRKSSGKTYGAGKLVELLLEHGVQVVILDTVGNWYGLRLAADGKSKGCDIPVIGGLRGDIPVEEAGGALVADALSDTGRSAIIDISQLSKAARQRFATAFGERLWLRKKADHHPAPLHLVIEECQLIIPQNGGAGAARMVGIYEEIVRLGRNYGIGVSMLSQRPQSVNKEVLNQTECLFAFQTNGSHEREALRKWIVDQGEGGNVDLVKALPSLPVGTAYVWSPHWLTVFKRVKIGSKRTYDASATPKVGERRVSAKSLAPLDLQDLATKMQEFVARARATDPKALRQRIAELEQKLHAAEAERAPVEPVEVPVLSSSAETLLSELSHRTSELTRALQAVLERFPPRSSMKSAPASQARAAMTTPSMPPSSRAASKLPSTPRPTARPREQNGAATAAVGAGGLRRILVALAQRPAGLSAKQVGVRAGLSSRSGTFTTYLGRARSSGWITGRSDRMQITATGLTALGAYEPLPTGRALLEHWLAELGRGGASRLLRVIADAHPHPITNAEAAAAAELSASSGTFTTYLGRLRSLELVHGRGEVRASDELFD